MYIHISGNIDTKENIHFFIIIQNIPQNAEGCLMITLSRICIILAEDTIILSIYIP